MIDYIFIRLRMALWAVWVFDFRVLLHEADGLKPKTVMCFILVVTMGQLVYNFEKLLKEGDAVGFQYWLETLRYTISMQLFLRAMTLYLL